MGLCKCHKKSVTNQFCFEHIVNVCEHCMVTNHSKCVVQSYLLWLQDNDYDPNCQLCKTPLMDGDCIRLICYHVFHWDCLNEYANKMPPHTAPAGYTCPTCNVGIFPPSNMVSPVAETLRNALLGVNWARCGLAFPLVDEDNIQVHKTDVNNVKLLSSNIEIEEETSELTNKPIRANDLIMNHPNHQQSEVTRGNRPEPYGASYSSGNFAASRKMYDTTEHSPLKPAVDHDLKKYKRRTAFEWLNRWFQSTNLLGGTRRDPHILYKRWVVMAMLALLILCTVIVWFLRLGRASADSDPMLDPHLNPNIRIQDNTVDPIAFKPDKDMQKGFPIDSGAKNILPSHEDEIFFTVQRILIKEFTEMLKS